MTKQQTEDEMTKATFRLPKSRLKEVQIYGIENDMTDQQIFNDALDAWMRTHQKKG
jgi:hypothetical protein